MTVPTLPDTARVTTYELSASTGPVDVGFDIYQTGTDYANWIEVWHDGEKLTASDHWTLDLSSGTLATAARPLSNARVTFTTARTGTIKIVGAARPRRTSVFTEGVGVPADDHNRAVNASVAMMREFWDKVTTRVLSVAPGDSLSPLGDAEARAEKFLFFDENGQPTLVDGDPAAPETGSLSTVLTDSPAVDQIAQTPSGYTASTGGHHPTFSVTPSASIVVSGIDHGYDGRRIHYRNDTEVGSSSDTGRLIILPHNAAAAAGPDRIEFPDQMPRFLMPRDSVDLVYTGSRWRFKGMDRWHNVFDVFSDMHVADFPTATNGASAAVTAGNYQSTSAVQVPIGIRSLATGTDTTGGASIGEFTSVFRPGLGSALFLARVAIVTAVDGTDTFAVRAGFHDASASDADVTDGVYWEYNWSGTAAQWERCAAGAGTRTKVTASLAPSTNYVWLGIFLNGDWTKANFFSADGAVWSFDGQIATANLPTAAEVFGFGVQVKKSAGTTSRNVHVDLMGYLYQVQRRSS